jgi:hypothetical protein
MSQWVTVTEFRAYFDVQQAPPSDTETDALLQIILDRAEAQIVAQLVGVTIELPAPEDLKQIELELAFSIYMTRGSASLLETIGAEGAGGYQYVGQLNDRQKNSLRQIRIGAAAVAF